jgi:hypothetical protein
MSKTIPKYLQKSLETRMAKGQQTRDSIVSIVKDSDQPLTINEITVLMTKSLGRKFAREYVAAVLAELAQEGKISARIETDAERQFRVRSNGRPQGRNSVLYASRINIPRTRAKIVDVPDSVKSHPYHKSKKKKSGKVKASVVQTAAVSPSLYSQIEQTIKPLFDRIEALETKLAKIHEISKP